MLHLPSALDLEMLSHAELTKKLSEILMVLKEKERTHEDAKDEQELYDILDTERIRRENTP